MPKLRMLQLDRGDVPEPISLNIEAPKLNGEIMFF
jgi:hypothetical protein